MTTANVGLTSAMGTRSDAQRRLEEAQKRLDQLVGKQKSIAVEKTRAVIEIEKLKIIGIKNILALGDQQKINANNKVSNADHGILLNAIAKTILFPVTKSQAPTATLAENANNAKLIAEPFLIKHEQLNTPELLHFVAEAKCMKLQSGTVKVIIDVLEYTGWPAPDLTRFQTQIDPKALETLLLAPQVSEVVFDPRVEGTPAMKKAKEVQTMHNSGLKLFYQTNEGLVEVKPMSLAVTTSTASPTPVPNQKKDSPENSPPKPGIVSKPLPAPPGKALPPTPVKRDKQP